MFLQQMNLDFMRSRLHGLDSDLTFLQEDDNTFKALLVVTSGFTITRKYDVTLGAHIDKLTIRLDTTQKLDNYKLADAVDLRIGATVTRYSIESRATTPQTDTSFGFSDLKQLLNELTEIVP